MKLSYLSIMFEDNTEITVDVNSIINWTIHNISKSIVGNNSLGLGLFESKFFANSVGFKISKNNSTNQLLIDKISTTKISSISFYATKKILIDTCESSFSEIIYLPLHLLSQQNTYVDNDGTLYILYDKYHKISELIRFWTNNDSNVTSDYLNDMNFS